MSGCTSEPTPSNDQPLTSTTNKTYGNYLGSSMDGNYIWGGAMNLAWNELCDDILRGDLHLNTQDNEALGMVEKLNARPFDQADLDVASYYIKAGYGQDTVTVINQESRAKFPDKSFDDLDIELAARDIIAYAYFLKKVEYLTEFPETTVYFNDDQVAGFYSLDGNQNENINLHQYQDDDNFIISLKLKDDQDRLFLAKGFDMDSPENALTAINENAKHNIIVSDIDRFEMPNIHLDYHRDYEELLGKNFTNPGFEEYLISQMFENIKFDLDHQGARVENEAVIVALEGAAFGDHEDGPKPKYLYLNKPFWIIMQRADRTNPYFILGVNNTKLMN
jgi:hypothetical protein